MRSLLLLLCTMLLQSLSVNAQLTITPSTNTGLFESAPSFTISGASGGTYKLYYHPHFQNPAIQTGTLTNGTLNLPSGITPGLIFITGTQSGQTVTSSLLYQPRKIAPKSAKPSGFYDYWETAVQNANKFANGSSGLPFEFQKTLIPGSDAGNNKSYKFTLRFRLGSNDNATLNGVVTVPKNSGPYPVIIKLPAYSSDPVNSSSIFGGDGLAYFSLSIHENPALYANNNNYMDISTSQNSTRENIYFKHVMIGAQRLIEYINTNDASLKADVNSIFTAGESQGGLALLIAGLDHIGGSSSVKAAASSQPGFGELQIPEAAGQITGAVGFPRWSGWLPSGSAPLEPSNTATAYYNAPYFLEYFDKPVMCDLGYLDTVCPAATVLSALNSLSDNIVIANKTKTEHSDHNEMFREYLGFFSNISPILYKSNTYYNAVAGPDRGEQPNTNVLLEGKVVTEDGSPYTINPTRFKNAQWEFVKCLSGNCGNLANNTIIGNTATKTYQFPGEGEYLLRFSINDIDRLSSENLFLTLRDHVIVNVTGNGGCNLSASTNTVNFPATGGTQNITISEAGYSLSSASPFTSSSSGTTATFTASANNTGSPRTATVTVSKAGCSSTTISISQPSSSTGGCAIDFTSFTEASSSICGDARTYSLAFNSTSSRSNVVIFLNNVPTNQFLNATSSDPSTPVITYENGTRQIKWTIASVAANTTYNAQFNFCYAGSNPPHMTATTSSNNSSSCDLTSGNGTPPACNLSASNNSVNFPATGGTQTITISEAGYSLSSASPFTASSNGTSATFTASANNTGSPRTATVTVSKAACTSTSISISQPSSSTGGCAINFTSFTEASSSICADARTYSLAFNSTSSRSNVVIFLNNVPTNQFLNATSSDPSTPVITYENGTRQIKWTIASVAANTTYNAQFNFCYAGSNPPHMTATTSSNNSSSCDLTSGNGTPPACNLSASNNSVNFPAAGGTQNITISEAGYSLSSASPFTSSISGTTVTFTASANNTGSPRTKTITVSKAGCTSTSINISQPSSSTGGCAINFTSFTEASSSICADANAYNLNFNAASSHSNVVIFLNNVPTNQFLNATSSDPSTPVITYENGFRQLKWAIASVAANTNYSASFNFCYAGSNPLQMTATTSTNNSSSCNITSSNNTRMAQAQTFEKASIKVYPNPSSGTNVSLEINVLQSEDASILLYDGLGRVVKEIVISLEKGQTTLPLATENLPTGIYRIRLVSSTEDRVTSLIIFE